MGEFSAAPRILRGHHGGGAGGGAPPLPINISAYFANAPVDGPYKCVKNSNSTDSDANVSMGTALASTQPTSETPTVSIKVTTTERSHKSKDATTVITSTATSTITSTTREIVVNYTSTLVTSSKAVATEGTSPPPPTTKKSSTPAPPLPPGKGSSIDCKSEDRCVCQQADIQVCKMTCNMDEKCVGYLEAATGGACEYATTAKCKSGCLHTGTQASGPVVKGPFVSDYLGCYEDVVKKAVAA